MKRLMINVVMVAVGLGVSLASRTSEAAEHDIQVGSFEGNWCDFDARFDIQNRVGDTWDFEGKLLIKATGQYDRITVVQYEDNHLRIVRHLSGAQSGSRQWVDTYPPQTLRKHGHVYVNFTVRSAGGYGSKPLGHLQMRIR